jgi:hypothetical protein
MIDEVKVRNVEQLSCFMCRSSLEDKPSGMTHSLRDFYGAVQNPASVTAPFATASS